MTISQTRKNVADFLAQLQILRCLRDVFPIAQAALDQVIRSLNARAGNDISAFVAVAAQNPDRVADLQSRADVVRHQSKEPNAASGGA